MRGAIVSVLVLGIFAASMLSLAVPAAAQNTSVPNSVPISHPRIRGSSDAQSLNWAGYAVTGSAGSITSVSGSWIVPALTCTQTTSYAAFWVGIDGYSSSTVEQTGTLGECSGGSATYYAWYEFYPSPMYEIPMTIVPGQTMSASVVYSGGEFTTSIEDVSTGIPYSTSATVSSAQESSAEWIVEAPSSGNSILPLANFGTAAFGVDNTGVGSTDYATVNGVNNPIGSFGSAVQPITMVSNSGSIEAQPSAISSDGTSFTVAWGSSTTSTSTSTSSSPSTSSSTSTSTSSSSSSSSSTSTSTTTTTTSTSSALVVTVSTSQSSYSPRSGMVQITVSVKTGTGSPVSRARVSVTVTTPNGGTASGTGMTGSSGAVVFDYFLGFNPPAGTYTVSATASASGYTSGSGSTTFTVT